MTFTCRWCRRSSCFLHSLATSPLSTSVCGWNRAHLLALPDAWDGSLPQSTSTQVGSSLSYLCHSCLMLSNLSFRHDLLSPKHYENFLEACHVFQDPRHNSAVDQVSCSRLRLVLQRKFVVWVSELVVTWYASKRATSLFDPYILLSIDSNPLSIKFFRTCRWSACWVGFELNELYIVVYSITMKRCFVLSAVKL